VAIDDHHIILEPVVTEKSVAASERQNTYTFRVDAKATKGQIRRAVEKLFGVKVEEVRTVTTHSKRRRARGRGRLTRSHVGKKALVKLAAEDRIDIF
jgi:large subunit ribosomal protein L23